MAHTPGPWLVSPFCARVEVPDADAPICELLWPTDLRSEDETYANARLISAAPDLLAALEHILAGALSLPRFAEDEARAAITKASQAPSRHE